MVGMIKSGGSPLQEEDESGMMGSEAGARDGQRIAQRINGWMGSGRVKGA
jgi:hypothetical protein